MRTQMPGFIKPQLATLRSTAPKGDLWLHEIKYDGYRVQVHVNGGIRFPQCKQRVTRSMVTSLPRGRPRNSPQELWFQFPCVRDII
jgi:hypothetical protein